ncbi:hypothetical protein ACFP1I_27700 [Dyadobacter subterraneus]|uniref:Uncharacterized protein n=1 Tax=Dyadobacter subterraneus TaxID=2773304 RepID=A0ABR9WDE3_9BACT|nr:hypothetical protein [Dyadobacter subterraneus]MBE9463149.1 hypothetical protein [Dyadobacter subterraneus]
MFAQICDKNCIANTTNSVNTTVAAVLAQSFVTVVGTQDSDNAKTSLRIIFPENISLNQETDFNPAHKIVLAYTVNDTEGYVVDPDKGVLGKLTVISLDKDKILLNGPFLVRQ